MGKTLDECYEVLGLDFNATEGMLPDKRERVLDLVCGFTPFQSSCSGMHVILAIASLQSYV